MNRVKTAVIPVAGLGTRLLPASKAIPKEMVPVVDKPVIQYVVEEAIAAGIKPDRAGYPVWKRSHRKSFRQAL